MLNNASARAAVGHVIDPVARGLLRLHVSPDAVTVAGTVGASAAGLWFYPRQQWAVGTLVILLFAFSDLLDGTMARMSGRQGPWGAFLDRSGVTGALRREVVETFLAGTLAEDDGSTSRRFVELLVRSFVRGTPSVPGRVFMPRRPGVAIPSSGGRAHTSDASGERGGSAARKRPASAAISAATGLPDVLGSAFTGASSSGISRGMRLA